MEGGRLERGTRVQIMPDIVTIGNTRLEVKEGENFTLKCDVLPGRTYINCGKYQGVGSGRNHAISSGSRSVKNHAFGSWMLICESFNN